MILLLCIIIVAGIKPGPEGMFCTEKEFTHCCKLVNNLSLLEDLEYSNSSQWRKAGGYTRMDITDDIVVQ